MDCSLSGDISEFLDVLHEEYDQFDVQQTTVGVTAEEFAAVAEQPDGAAFRARIECDDSVLMEPVDDGWALPSGVVGADPNPETLAELVYNRTGVRCEIDGIDRVSIACLGCEELGENIWVVSVLFAGTEIGGTPRNGVVWREEPVEPMAVPSA